MSLERSSHSLSTPHRTPSSTLMNQTFSSRSSAACDPILSRASNTSYRSRTSVPEAIPFNLNEAVDEAESIKAERTAARQEAQEATAGASYNDPMVATATEASGYDDDFDANADDFTRTRPPRISHVQMFTIPFNLVIPPEFRSSFVPPGHAWMHPYPYVQPRQLLHSPINRMYEAEERKRMKRQAMLEFWNSRGRRNHPHHYEAGLRRGEAVGGMRQSDLMSGDFGGMNEMRSYLPPPVDQKPLPPALTPPIFPQSASHPYYPSSNQTAALSHPYAPIPMPSRPPLFHNARAVPSTVLPNQNLPPPQQQAYQRV